MNPIDLNDPRLTAYALGEMAPAERAEFEQALQHDPAATAAIAEIRRAGVLLADALETEPFAATAETPINLTARKSKPDANRDPYAKGVRFPYWMISSLAAACFAVVFLYWNRHQLPPDSRHYVEVPLAAPAAEDKAGLPEKAKGEGVLAVTSGSEAEMASAVVSLAPFSVKQSRLVQAKDEWGGRAVNAPARPMSTGAVAMVPVELDRIRPRTALGGIARKDDGTLMTGGKEPGLSWVEAYQRSNPFQLAARNPVSMVPADAGTTSYAEVSQSLGLGRLPPVAAVRIEELINHFAYAYDEVPRPAQPFDAHLEVAGAPWAPDHRLVRIGLTGRAIGAPSPTTDPGRGDTASKDSATEARFSTITGTGTKPLVIAQGLSIQVEFDPAQVRAYRLIGYDTRPQAAAGAGAAARSGEVRAGYVLTALYEIVPVNGPRPPKTGRSEKPLLAVRIRYEDPAEGKVCRLDYALTDSGATFAQASQDFKFTAAVAAFGMLLREAPAAGAQDYSMVAAWAREGLGRDPGGQRHEFLGLIERAGTAMH